MKYCLISILSISLASTAFAGGHGHDKYSASKKVLREQHHQDMSNVLNAEQMNKYIEMKKRHNHKGKPRSEH